MEKETINKLSSSLNEIRNAKDISTFVIIKRDDTSLWDIVIGGHNLDNQENLIQIADILKKSLLPNELRDFSRIVLLNSTDNFISNLRKTFSLEHGSMELQNAQINSIFIKHAYLLFSK
ncbi:MAG: hypothetical protein WCW54_01415 [Candidatus Paceibacterota bacterium]